MWVIAWRPFDPSGLFVSGIGNLKENENAVLAKHGLQHAKRFSSRGEAQMFFNSVKEMPHHTYWKDWVIVQLEDHHVYT